MKSKYAAARSPIPKEEWLHFIETFAETHRGWSTQLETTDHGTRETELSLDLPLQSIELDLEDEKNPRINVSVKFDNKMLKHILFRPSRLVLNSTLTGGDCLEVETINTTTRIHLRR